MRLKGREFEIFSIEPHYIIDVYYYYYFLCITFLCHRLMHTVFIWQWPIDWTVHFLRLVNTRRIFQVWSIYSCHFQWIENELDLCKLARRRWHHASVRILTFLPLNSLVYTSGSLSTALYFTHCNLVFQSSIVRMIAARFTFDLLSTNNNNNNNQSGSDSASFRRHFSLSCFHMFTFNLFEVQIDRKPCNWFTFNRPRFGCFVFARLTLVLARFQPLDFSLFSPVRVVFCQISNSFHFNVAMFSTLSTIFLHRVGSISSPVTSHQSPVAHGSKIVVRWQKTDGELVGCFAIKGPTKLYRSLQNVSINQQSLINKFESCQCMYFPFHFHSVDVHWWTEQFTYVSHQLFPVTIAILFVLYTTSYLLSTSPSPHLPYDTFLTTVFVPFCILSVTPKHFWFGFCQVGQLNHSPPTCFFFIICTLQCFSITWFDCHSCSLWI